MRVVDLSQNIAGPFCTQVLGDLGADVIKIEKPGLGDDARSWTPPSWNEDSTAYLAMNRSKRSVALDLKSEAGMALFRRLLDKADVFLHSLAPGAAERNGVDAESCRAQHPRLIYCAVTSFGEVGPLRHLPGYDALMQAYSGLMSMTGHPGQPPVRVGGAVVDLGTGMWTALGILAALRQRDQTGQGGTVTSALFETAVTWISYPLVSYLATGQAPKAQGSGIVSISPYQAFPSADGAVMIAAANDRQFQNLCRAVGLADCATDPRFQNNPGRVAHREELAQRVSDATRAFRSAELLRLLEEARVPCAPVLGVDEVATHAQTEASEMLVPLDHPRIPSLRTVATPVRWNGERATPSRPPPLLGQHTREVLTEVGLSPAEIERLKQDGVVGEP